MSTLSLPPVITRKHNNGDTRSVAVYSDCERYRYQLTRVWRPQGKRVLFVMLNPSTATEVQNDPTVERCERRARTLGFGAFRVTNIFAWRDTDPGALRTAKDPVGPRNNRAILNGAAWADAIVAAWGTHGAHLDRGPEVERLLREAGFRLHHLGLSKAGHPKHPLYIGYRKRLEVWG